MVRQAAQRPPKQSAPSQPNRDHQVLNQKRAPQVQSIADAVVIKDQALFLITDRDGRMPLSGPHGFGLYFNDCRFLDGYEFYLADALPSRLVATPRRGSTAELELTNPGFRTAQGKQVKKEDLGIRWQRVLDAAHQTLHDRLTFQNYSQEEVRFPVRLTLRAQFEDVFVVRGMSAEHLGKLQPPRWQDGTLFFSYAGSDGIARSVQVQFAPAPTRTEDATAHFDLILPARENRPLSVTFVLRESPQGEDVQPQPPPHANLEGVQQRLDQSSDRWLEDRTQVRSDSLFLERILERSLRDLHVLRSQQDQRTYFAAGVPWYVALFGRDSLISAYQILAYEPDIAAQTLRLLARYQGTKVDTWRAEQPGKILHELRVGELARKGAIPQTPYYGSIDSTPLFLIVLGGHAAWTGDLSLFQELRDSVEQALAWMDHFGDFDGDGYLEYQNESSKGLANQGWKDSGDSIVNADGSLATPPIRLVEVQGYAYLARQCSADLFERAGEGKRAQQLRQQAQQLRERFNRDFWLKDKEFYALALQADERPAAVISSNPGQALWCGIIDEDKAAKVTERLLADDMFSGWGVRTLSTRERRYNPIGYHDGTVWPHDNSFVLAGLRRYGADKGALRIFAGITEAALHFHAYRLPEVFAGFARAPFGTPVHYPVACHPQAWAAGSVPFMLMSLLGLEPQAFAHQLHIVRPLLPDHVNWIELHGLRVGPGQVDVRFQRAAGGTTQVDVLRNEGNVDVMVEQGSTAGTTQTEQS